MDDRRRSGPWKDGIAPPADALEQDDQPGPYQYYQPPPRASDTIKRSFSQRAAGADSVPFDERADPLRTDLLGQQDHLRSAAQALNAKLAEPLGPTLTSDPETLSALLSQTQHVHALSSPALQPPPPPAKIDPDYVPDNLRGRVWSPGPAVAQNDLPISPIDESAPPAQPKTRQVSGASNASESLRRTSVSDRSPLQHLESWTKQEKRARVAEAE
jgi:hypothetical protein